jgi:DNA-binding response OmpR family regulator
VPKETILIADDDRVIVTMLSEFLRKKGFQVVLAFDSMQAMLGVRNAGPKLIILDLSMPGGAGMDVIRKTRAMTKTAQTPIIVLTGASDPKLADEARALGADEFLTKPVKLEQLYAAVLNALGRPPEDAGAAQQS